MGNNSLAIKDFKEAIRLQENYSPAHYYLGLSLLQNRNPDKALKSFERAFDCDTEHENPGIFDGMAQCYHQLGNYTEAMLKFNEAIEAEKAKKNDFPVQVLKNFAQCHFDNGNYEESIRQLEQALLANDRDASVLYKLGLSLYANKKFKMAVSTLKACLKNQPYSTYKPDVFYHIGLAYCRLEKFEKSIFPYSQCI